MEHRPGQRRRTIFLALTLFWIGQPICLALVISNCDQIERPLTTYVWKYFSLCSPPLNSRLIVSCSNLTTLPEDIMAIPKEVDALCVAGEIKQLKEQTFRAFPELRYLRLHLGYLGVVISPRAFIGLGKLQHLSIMHKGPGHPCPNITISFEMLLPITSLQNLHLMNIRLTTQRGTKFHIQLRSVSISGCCLRQVTGMFSIFPFLRLLSQVSLDRCRMESNVSSLWQHPNQSAFAVPASQSQKERTSFHDQNRSPLGSLKLSNFPLSPNDLLDLEIEKLDSLSLWKTNSRHDKKVTYQVCALVLHFSLQSLTFSHNYYKSLDSEELLGCYSVENLVLEENNMEQVDSLILYKLPRLQLLDLSGNHLHWDLCPLVYEKMNFTSRLRILDFSGNRFNGLQSSVFSCLPFLETLSLNDCGFEKIPISTFSGLGQLNILNLSKNKISHLHHHLFLNLSRLTSLDLRGNRLEMLRTYFFQGLNMLRELYVATPQDDLIVDFSVPGLKLLYIDAKSRIRFQEESMNIFSTVEKLTVTCPHFEVDSCKSPFFPKVKELFLSNIASVTFFCNTSRPFFHHFPLLQKLNYRNGSWGSHREGLNFSHLPNLRILVLFNLATALKDMSIHDFQYLFRNLTQLEVMHLMNSGLKSLSDVLFQDMMNLQLLVLENELIFTLDSGFPDEIKQLKYLYLYGVTLGCYCSNAWFVSWTYGKEDLYVTSYSLYCEQLIRVKKTMKFMPFVEQTCSLKIDFILFVVTSFLLFLLMSFPLVHATCGPEIFFLIYLLRGWWHRLCGAIGKDKRFEYDAFVSYCMQDQEWVLQYLVPNLEQKGPPFLKLCVHSRDFVVGKAIVDNIMDNLYSSRKAICVISRHSLYSHWCSLELNLATYRLLTEGEDTLILVFLEHISKYQLSAYHRLAKLVKRKTYLDWPKEPAAQLAFWDRLRNSLRQCCVEEDRI